MDEKQKEQFIKLTNFLGQVLGKQYEVVFHVLSKEGAYIAAIANSHVSGRTLESPLSAFASELVQNKAYLKEDFLCDYKALIGKSKLVINLAWHKKKRLQKLYIKRVFLISRVLCL